MASYIESILEPGERVRFWGDIHWLAYIIGGFLLGTSLLLLGLFVYDLAVGSSPTGGILFVALPLLLVGLLIIINCLTTEIAVTNRRVVMKTGFIARRTTEMNLSKTESVDVRQSILGRLLGYGTVTVRGTGSGLTPFKFIDKPLDFRRAILTPVGEREGGHPTRVRALP